MSQSLPILGEMLIYFMASAVTTSAITHRVNFTKLKVE